MSADVRDPDAQLRDALLLHRSGNLGAAIAIYRALLPRTRNGAHLLFRQRAYNDWAPVVADVRERLGRLVRQGGFQ